MQPRWTSARHPSWHLVGPPCCTWMRKKLKTGPSSRNCSSSSTCKSRRTQQSWRRRPGRTSRGRWNGRTSNASQPNTLKARIGSSSRRWSRWRTSKPSGSSKKIWRSETNRWRTAFDNRQLDMVDRQMENGWKIRTTKSMNRNNHEIEVNAGRMQSEKSGYVYK